MTETEASIPRFELAEDHDISQIVAGGWQLADGHSEESNHRNVIALEAALDAGITTFDCADIYTGVEASLGEFRKHLRIQRGEESLSKLKVHTKFVPDLDALPTISKSYVTKIIERSMTRLDTDQLDLVQFHWWDFDIPGYVETAGFLSDLQTEGKIRYVGLTNFDVPHTRELLEAGVSIVSNQVQFSVLDQRPLHGMDQLCQAEGIHLLCYGTLAGGLISNRFVDASGLPDPVENRSQTKYGLIIEELGGWDYFHKILGTLNAIARKHDVSVSNIAERYVLQQPSVAGIIVGARSSDHIASNRQTFSFELDTEDLEDIQNARAESSWQGEDIYDLERVKGGRHATIMKYNLNHSAT